MFSASLGALTVIRTFDRFAVDDTLRRVSELHEGELDANSSSIAVPSRLQVLGRNSAGRVSRDRVDLNGNGDFINGPPDATAFGEMDDTRVYNKRNELRERSVLDSTNPTTPRGVSLDYDRNGNLTSDGEKHTYTFNPFGQLVRIDDYGTVPLPPPRRARSETSTARSWGQPESPCPRPQERPTHADPAARLSRPTPPPAAPPPPHTPPTTLRPAGQAC